VQKELKERIEKLFDIVQSELEEDIVKNGHNDPQGLRGTILDFAKVIPIIRKKDGFTTWEDYGILGRMIFFDLGNYI
jgi:hypothetical protein